MVVPILPEPTNLFPCWLHVVPLLVKIQAAPRLLLSFGPPMIAVFPLADKLTEYPC